MIIEHAVNRALRLALLFGSISESQQISIDGRTAVFIYSWKTFTSQTVAGSCCHTASYVIPAVFPGAHGVLDILACLTVMCSHVYPICLP
jgi:hypothetical protein